MNSFTIKILEFHLENQGDDMLTRFYDNQDTR